MHPRPGWSSPWVADHRKHHAFTDRAGDSHSPHLSGPGFVGAFKGLLHAHVGWLFETVGQAERERFAPDPMKDRTMRVIDRLFLLWAATTRSRPPPSMACTPGSVSVIRQAC